MKNLTTRLTEEECDRLDRFLLDRIDEEADTQDKDEGVLDISELDGLFTALVSGPVSAVPSQWLPVVWGDFEPVWESQEEFEEIFSLMIRHMNGIAHLLMEYPEEFEPMFLERDVEGRTYTIVDEWCEGYVRGVELAEATGIRVVRSWPICWRPSSPLPRRRNGAGTISTTMREKVPGRQLHLMCEKSTPTGWNGGPTMHRWLSRYVEQHRGRGSK